MKLLMWFCMGWVAAVVGFCVIEVMRFILDIPTVAVWNELKAYMVFMLILVFGCGAYMAAMTNINNESIKRLNNR